MTKAGPAASAAVIGAGFAGLAAARELAARGLAVTVFEKSRGIGGRAATRRHEHDLQTFSFDHGAQYFTATTPPFTAVLAPFLADGRVQEWTGRMGVSADATLTPSTGTTTRLVSVPGMNSLAKALASDLQVLRESRVERMHEDGGNGWRLELSSGARTELFDYVVIAIPDAQARALCEQSGLTSVFASVPQPVLAPCWAVMAAFRRPVAVAFDGIFVNESVIRWAARDSSKPGRSAAAETWVIHLSPAASESRLDESPEVVARAGLAAFAKVCGRDLQEDAIFVRAHLWRFATVTTELDIRFIFIPERRVGLCGDWLCAGRVEGAFSSGRELALRISEEF